MQKFQLFTHPDSANGRKVLALAYHLALNPEVILINVYQGQGQDAAYLKVNPFGKIPSLREGDFVLWESNAILQYLAERQGDYQCTSEDPQIRAEIAKFLFWESAHWQAQLSTVLAASVGHRLLPNYFPEPQEKPDWKQLALLTNLIYLEAHLSKRKFLVNEQLSIADFSIAGMMSYFRFAEFPFDEYPAIENWYLKIEALPAWQASQSELWR